MLHQKAISSIPFQAEGCFFSHIFLRKNPTLRKILINSELENSQCVSEVQEGQDGIYLRSKGTSVSPKAFMVSLDLSDAYLHIPIHLESKRFAVKRIRKDAVLPV